MKIGNRYSVIVSCLVLLLSTAAVAQEIKKDTPLVTSDQPGASSVGIAKSGARAKILERKGFWVKIEAGEVIGWTKISALQFGGAGSGKIAIDTGRMSNGNIVSSSAARGMTKGEFLDAAPNAAPLAVLKDQVPPAEAIVKFAEAGKLTPRKIAALAVPAASPTPATEGGGAKKSSSQPKEDW
jgi:hypothetical protein